MWSGATVWITKDFTLWGRLKIMEIESKGGFYFIFYGLMYTYIYLYICLSSKLIPKIIWGSLKLLNEMLKIILIS